MGKADRLDRLIGTPVLFLFPITTLGARDIISLGALAAVPLVVVLVAAVPRFRHSLPFCLVWLGCLACGPVLTSLSVDDNIGRSEDTGMMVRLLAALAVAGLGFILLLWGRWKFGARYTLAVFAAGTLAQALITPALWLGNPWKYALAWPVAVLLLTLRRRGNGALLLVALAGVSVVFDFRSFAAVCVLAAALVVWRRRPNEGRQRTLRPLVVVAVLAIVGLQVGTWLALHGDLGYSIQSRTFEQTQGGEQSVLVGARPEWAATTALMRHRPIGYGPGLVPALDDVTAARSGLYSVGGATEGEYVDDYMFGGRIELHSVAADLWVNFGPLGLVLAVMLGGAILLALGRSLSAGGLQGWWAFLAMLGLWDLMFSPIGSNLMHVVVAAAMALPLLDRPATGEVEAEAAGHVLVASR